MLSNSLNFTISGPEQEEKAKSALTRHLRRAGMKGTPLPA